MIQYGHNCDNPMKNLMVFVGRTKGFYNDYGTQAKIQIDNSLDLGWRKEDIIFATNFDFEYRGVKSLIVSDDNFVSFSPEGSKITAILELFYRGYIDKGVLYLYSHNRTEIFSRDFGSENLGGPINFIFSGTDRKIGVFDINKKLIYLINREGKTIEGFPLRGASMFSIGRLTEKSGWHLIVGGTDRFLYNYRIETDNK